MPINKSFLNIQAIIRKRFDVGIALLPNILADVNIPYIGKCISINFFKMINCLVNKEETTIIYLTNN